MSTQGLPDRLICLDPGLKSGVAVLLVEGDTVTLSTSDELDVHATMEWLASQVSGAALHSAYFENERTELIAETFIITTETAKKSQSPWSLRLLGVAEFCCLVYGDGLPLIEQKPSEAKRVVSNQILKNAGLWHKGGDGHANDAIRHGVYRLLRCGWRPEGILPV